MENQTSPLTKKTTKRGNPPKRVRKDLWPLIDFIIALDKESSTARLVFEGLSKWLAELKQDYK